MIIYPELASSVPECRHILTKRKKSKIFFNFLSETGELDQANNWVKIVIFFFFGLFLTCISFSIWFIHGHTKKWTNRTVGAAHKWKWAAGMERKGLFKFKLTWEGMVVKLSLYGWHMPSRMCLSFPVEWGMRPWLEWSAWLGLERFPGVVVAVNW